MVKILLIVLAVFFLIKILPFLFYTVWHLLITAGVVLVIAAIAFALTRK